MYPSEILINEYDFTCTMSHFTPMLIDTLFRSAPVADRETADAEAMFHSGQDTYDDADDADDAEYIDADLRLYDIAIGIYNHLKDKGCSSATKRICLPFSSQEFLHAFAIVLCPTTNEIHVLDSVGENSKIDYKCWTSEASMRRNCRVATICLHKIAMPVLAMLVATGAAPKVVDQSEFYAMQTELISTFGGFTEEGIDTFNEQIQDELTSSCAILTAWTCYVHCTNPDLEWVAISKLLTRTLAVTHSSLSALVTTFSNQLLQFTSQASIAIGMWQGVTSLKNMENLLTASKYIPRYLLPLNGYMGPLDAPKSIKKAIASIQLHSLRPEYLSCVDINPYKITFWTWSRDDPRVASFIRHVDAHRPTMPCEYYEWSATDSAFNSSPLWHYDLRLEAFSEEFRATHFRVIVRCDGLEDLKACAKACVSAISAIYGE